MRYFAYTDKATIDSSTDQGKKSRRRGKATSNGTWRISFTNFTARTCILIFKVRANKRFVQREENTGGQKHSTVFFGNTCIANGCTKSTIKETSPIMDSFGRLNGFGVR